MTLGHVHRVAAGANHCSHAARVKQAQGAIVRNTETGDRTASGVGRVGETLVERERQPARSLLFSWDRRESLRNRSRRQVSSTPSGLHYYYKRPSHPSRPVVSHGT